MDANRPSLFAPLLATAISLAIAVDQIQLAVRARHAEVAHLLALPPLWLWIPAAVLAVVALGIGLGLTRKRGDLRFARLPLLFLVVLVFVDIFVTPSVRPPALGGDSNLIVRGIAALVEQASSDTGKLPANASELAPVLSQLGAPPYLMHGERRSSWELRIDQNCTGPLLDRADAGAGTLLYCLAADGKHGWLTVVGLASSRFGSAELLRAGSAPAVAQITAAPPPGSE